VRGIEQEQVAAPFGIAVRAEDALHLLLEVKAQAQHAHHRAGLGVVHAARVNQGAALARPQVAGAERFHVAVAGRGWRISGSLLCPGAWPGRSAPAHCPGVQQHDLVIHGVLAAVLAQAVVDAGTLSCRPATKLQSSRSVARKPTSAVRSYRLRTTMSITYWAGADLAEHGADLFLHQAGHQLLLELGEAAAGGRHGGQDGARLLRAVHLAEDSMMRHIRLSSAASARSGSHRAYRAEGFGRIGAGQVSSCASVLGQAGHHQWG
jgi:hypothetical protein